MERKRLLVIICFVALSVLPIWAYEGLSISTAYPAITVAETDMIVLDLKVRNYQLEPQRVDLTLHGLPEDWDYEFVGGGGLVRAVFVDTDETTNVQLWIAPPRSAQEGSYDFTVTATGTDSSFSLPLTIRVGHNLPQRLSLDPELPSVRGTPDSDFTFSIKIQNNSAQEVLVDLDTQTPDGFYVKFTQQYGSTSISALPLKPGASETVKMIVTPPKGISEGSYPITMVAKSEGAQAVTHLTMEIEGQAKLSLAGAGGLLSGSAVAGKDKVFTLELKNTGTAIAKDITLSSYQPMNWNVEFSPDTIESLDPGATKEVKATIRPSSEALTGDYNVTLRANSPAGSVSENFRITVRTSSLWGVVAILIIAAAVVVLVLAVRKFGRR